MSKATAKATTKKTVPTPKSVSWHAYMEVVNALKNAKEEIAALEADLDERDVQIGVLENNMQVAQNNVSGLVSATTRLSYLLEVSLEVAGRVLRDK